MPLGLLTSYIVALVYPYARGELTDVSFSTYSPILLAFFVSFMVGMFTGIGFLVPNYLRIIRGVGIFAYSGDYETTSVYPKRC